MGVFDSLTHPGLHICGVVSVLFSTTRAVSECLCGHGDFFICRVITGSLHIIIFNIFGRLFSTISCGLRELFMWRSISCSFATIIFKIFELQKQPQAKFIGAAEAIVALS